MRKIFIDSDFKCHLTNLDGNFREIETSYFDEKCDSYVEGYRFVPEGEIWEREDGEVFECEMIAPHTDFNELQVEQLEYEIEDAKNALSILLGGGV
jgi:hypothetical protein